MVGHKGRGTGPPSHPHLPPCPCLGHAWLYVALHQLTGQGANSRLAQYLATAVYVTNLALVFRLLLRTEKVPSLLTPFSP